MSQTTHVQVLNTGEGESLRNALNQADFEFRSLNHAQFSARGEGVSVTLYKSGKLVVQGGELELFLERYLGTKLAAGPPSKAEAAGGAPGKADEPLLGGDESGKGDYFGPLVVAAIRIDPSDVQKLRQGPVADSKKVNDGLILRTAPGLRARFPHAVRVLDPLEYNRRHGETGNVAILLSQLYREAVEEIAEPGDAVLIDQFSKNKDRLESVFKGLDVKLFQRHRAESALSVAAASFLAREAFIVRLKELGDEFAIDLPKGAGPVVDRAGRQFLKQVGRDRLGEVAKLHFRTTKKIGAE